VSAPRVLLAEPDAATRMGLRVALEDGGFEVMGEVGEPAALASAVADASPDLVLVAAALLEVVPELAAAHPGVRIVVLTPRTSGDELLEAVLAGASGYLGADVDGGRLPHVLRGVLAGEVALPRRHTERLLDELRRRRAQRATVAARASAPLTDREWEVLELLAGAASSAEIARRLRISEVTVRRHVSAAVAKLGVADRAAAVRLLAQRSAG
jgi:DNA-binding NarL/FixJ family response regulator